ncbi:hypothetical protein AMECASPLE_036609 [Ameca splendens]|uniref:Uncharacterized protein n=1 Tax=Ameca splendens TaxID=208324 RepID=A0ABV0YIS2_9TELE
MIELLFSCYYQAVRITSVQHVYLCLTQNHSSGSVFLLRVNGHIIQLQVADDPIDCQALAGRRWSVVFVEEGIGPQPSVAGNEALMTNGETWTSRGLNNEPHLSVDRLTHKESLSVASRETII